MPPRGVNLRKRGGGNLLCVWIFVVLAVFMGFTKWMQSWRGSGSPTTTHAAQLDELAMKHAQALSATRAVEAQRDAGLATLRSHQAQISQLERDLAAR